MIDEEVCIKAYLYFCELIQDQCGETDGDEPECNNCSTLKEWRESGLGINEFWEER